jgi:hypothetical protein
MQVFVNTIWFLLHKQRKALKAYIAFRAFFWIKRHYDDKKILPFPYCIKETKPEIWAKSPALFLFSPGRFYLI